jgi:hypothetical protein
VFHSRDYNRAACRASASLLATVPLDSGILRDIF